MAKGVKFMVMASSWQMIMEHIRIEYGPCDTLLPSHPLVILRQNEPTWQVDAQGLFGYARHGRRLPRLTFQVLDVSVPDKSGPHF